MSLLYSFGDCPLLTFPSLHPPAIGDTHYFWVEDERRRISFKLQRLGWLVTSLRGEKTTKASPRVSEQFERDRAPVMLAIPCSFAGETQIPFVEGLGVQAANKNDPALMRCLDFLKLYLPQSPLMNEQNEGYR